MLAAVQADITHPHHCTDHLAIAFVALHLLQCTDSRGAGMKLSCWPLPTNEIYQNHTHQSVSNNIFCLKCRWDIIKLYYFTNIPSTPSWRCTCRS